MRLFAIVEQGKLQLVNNVTDEYFFSGKVMHVKDYVQDSGDYLAVRKGDNYGIYSIEEYHDLFGDKFYEFDEEAYFSRVA